MASSDTGLICWRPVSDPPLGYRLQTVTANENSADITYSFYPFATKLGRLCFDYIVRKRQSEEHEDRIVAEWNRGFIEKCLPHGFRSHPSQTNRQLEHGEMRSSVHEIGSLSSDKRTSVTVEYERESIQHGLDKETSQELFDRHMICDFLNEC